MESGVESHVVLVMDMERLVRRVWPDGQVDYFEGDMDMERKVRIKYPNGSMKHMCGFVFPCFAKDSGDMWYLP